MVYILWAYPCVFKQYINEDTIKAYFISTINDKFEKNSDILDNIDCFLIVRIYFLLFLYKS